MTGEMSLMLISLLLVRLVLGCPEECICSARSETVDCRNRGLSEIPSSLPREAQVLYLQGNHIQGLNQSVFADLALLEQLDLSNNNISGLHTRSFEGLINLQVLNLTSNYIQHIDEKLFGSVQHLSKLDLSANSISSLPSSFGNGLKNLTWFAISHNKILNISRSLLDSLSNLQVFHFKDNPWLCNCSIVGLKLWLEYYLFRGGTIDEILCEMPEKLKGKDLLKVPYEIYRMCPPSSSHILLPSSHYVNPDHQTRNEHVLKGEHEDNSDSDCEPKLKPKPLNLRHAVATVVITGVVCGIVCLMMLAAAIYGCAYAAIMAKYHRDLKKVQHLAQATEQGSAEEKEPLDNSLA
ncbi:leucine-rich repeat and transmembrane domain-containing protein 1 [Protopterus annectens]|uniref:leucine-rich repeat and transmembrane domain-containing protein 1 n=1 Tax=Protopterus annectens TaxID=7888 RepID=UPI001CF95CED|nr:leucine-rich repeat and transmembrane domain-containing protein 1 [Protopterus annectens]